MSRSNLSRRKFLASSLVGAVAGCHPELLAAEDAGSRQATGVKVGEVSQTSAIVWLRLTAQAALNTEGKSIRTRKGETLPTDVKIDGLRGACPGAPGVVRLRYGTREDLGDAREPI